MMSGLIGAGIAGVRMFDLCENLRCWPDRGACADLAGVRMVR